MKNIALTLFGLLLVAMPAAADILKSAAGSECQYMTSYRPDPANDAEYKPGVDVHGKPVVEADITPNVITMPDKITFDLTVDTAKYIGLALPQGVEGLAKVGTVTIEKGQTYFNGKPLAGEAEAALQKLCNEQKSKKRAKRQKM